MFVAVSARLAVALWSCAHLATPLGAAQGIAGDVTASLISADSTRVVYRADLERDDVFELYSVPIAGGPSRKLNRAPVPQGDVEDFRISPDSRRVVYRGDVERNDVFELYSSALNGRLPAALLNGPLVAGGDVASFELSGDSRHVVYLADQDVDGRTELYSAPLTGGASVKLNDPLSPGGVVNSFVIAPSGKRVVYLVRQDASGTKYELYTVATQGGVPVKLNEPLGPGMTVKLDYFVSPDSRHIVFRVDRNTQFEPRLYAASILGGPPIELGQFVRDGDYQITPDSSRVVHIGVNGFLVVPILGGSATRLELPFVPGHPSRIDHFGVSPDSRFVVCHFESGDAEIALFSLPLGGGAPVELSSTNQHGHEVDGGSITLDSTRVLAFVFGSVEELYSIPISGGPAVLLEVGEPFGAFSPDSNRFVYTNSSGVYELFSVPVTGGTPVKLNPGLVTGGNVVGLPIPEVSPDSVRVVYRADQDTNDVIELYSVPIGGGPAIKLNSPPAIRLPR
ncbi:MAG: hypothetical protein HOP15_14705 [Planctomycetes bacterium]|nr:hypothetical protein [Planctomycetota bacterium]